DAPGRREPGGDPDHPPGGDLRPPAGGPAPPLPLLFRGPRLRRDQRPDRDALSEDPPPAAQGPRPPARGPRAAPVLGPGRWTCRGGGREGRIRGRMRPEIRRLVLDSSI